MNNSLGIDAFSFRFSKWSVFEIISNASQMGFSSVSIDIVDQHDLNEKNIKEVVALSKKLGVKIY